MGRNSLEPDQARSDLGPLLVKKLLKHFSRRQQQTSFVGIGALRVNKEILYVYRECDILYCYCLAGNWQKNLN